MSSQVNQAGRGEINEVKKRLFGAKKWEASAMDALTIAKKQVEHAEKHLKRASDQVEEAKADLIKSERRWEVIGIDDDEPTPAAKRARKNHASGDLYTNAVRNDVRINTVPSQLELDDALHYIRRVKLEFGHRPQTYNKFLEFLQNYRANRINTLDVMVRIRSLFSGHHTVLLGFNSFLPHGYNYGMRNSKIVMIVPRLDYLQLMASSREGASR